MSSPMLQPPVGGHTREEFSYNNTTYFFAGPPVPVTARVHAAPETFFTRVYATYWTREGRTREARTHVVGHVCSGTRLDQRLHHGEDVTGAGHVERGTPVLQGRTHTHTHTHTHNHAPPRPPDQLRSTLFSLFSSKLVPCISDLSSDLKASRPRRLMLVEEGVAEPSMSESADGQRRASGSLSLKRGEGTNLHAHP
eukprot:2839273-Pyramimonas_sp.AAC.1